MRWKSEVRAREESRRRGLLAAEARSMESIREISWKGEVEEVSSEGYERRGTRRRARESERSRER